MPFIALAILVFAGNAMAVITYGTFTDTRNIYRMYNFVEGAGNSDIWYHDNPAETAGFSTAEYTGMAASGNIVDVELTIVVDDLDDLDTVNVFVKDIHTAIWHDVGDLTNQGFVDWPQGPVAGAGGATPSHIMSTTFTLDPTWLNGLPVEIMFEAMGSNDFEIETSTLTLTAIPAPGAILLGSIGVGLVGWLRRRRTL